MMQPRCCNIKTKGVCFSKALALEAELELLCPPSPLIQFEQFERIT